ncbi:MAG: DNA-directed RNA polymerase subunit alpha [Bacteroidales bacterium]|jgi:DNA-directed RNA polymerase subunit alpha|nr:DNA-directed RNA polymerase subunit alpha [Bacteroidales bacterium]
MAILPFQQPDKVIMNELNEYEGSFEFRPLEPGFGLTIGNALRRVLLSSLEGYAIVSVRIEGVEQEFSTIKGVMEDVTEIVLNLKQVRFKRINESEEKEKINFTITEQDTFTAGDMNKYLTVFQVLNTDTVICRMEPTVKLVFEIIIRKGRGYVTADENKDPNAHLGTISIDSIHTPIKNVKYIVEDYRVEQKTDFENLILTVITDGSIFPKDAIKEAAQVLIHHFMLLSDEKISIVTEEKHERDEFDENTLHVRQVLQSRLSDLGLSVRAFNCLKAADIETLGDLVVYNKNDLLKFRNFGKKSLAELEELLASKGLEFGMNIAKYKLDKE